MLLRYLKINVLKLCNFPSSFLQTLDAVEESSAEVGVTMCESCRGVTLNFCQLYQEFERIRLQLDKCVKSLYGFMINGGHQQDRVREYKKRIRLLSGADLFTASFGESLKKEILQKCAAKVESSAPKISVVKLPCVVNDVVTPAYSGCQLPSFNGLENTTSRGNVNLPTSKRSKSKFSTTFSTISNVDSAVTEPKVAETTVSNDVITEDFSNGAGMEDSLDDKYEHPLVKVEIEMATNTGYEDSVQEFSALSEDIDTSQYAYK